jgi:hypothetical protein
VRLRQTGQGLGRQHGQRPLDRPPRLLGLTPHRMQQRAQEVHLLHHRRHAGMPARVVFGLGRSVVGRARVAAAQLGPGPQHGGPGAQRRGLSGAQRVHGGRHLRQGLCRAGQQEEVAPRQRLVPRVGGADAVSQLRRFAQALRRARQVVGASWQSELGHAQHQHRQRRQRARFQRVHQVGTLAPAVQRVERHHAIGLQQVPRLGAG